jgi:hypothetical protein
MGTNGRCDGRINSPPGASLSGESFPHFVSPRSERRGRHRERERERERVGDARGGEELVGGGGRNADGRRPVLVAAADPGGQVRWRSRLGTSVLLVLDSY